MVLVIFGLDGASIDLIRSAAKRNKLSNFERLLEEGSASPLLSVYPYVTAPAWTTMFSGVNPGKHGIFDMFEISGDHIEPSNMRRSSVPFLWDYLSWARKKVLVLGVPFIYPAPNINGVFVTGRFVTKLSTFPADLGDKFDLSGFEYRELPTEQEIEMKISQGMREMSLRMLESLDFRMKASLALIDSNNWDAIILVDNLPDEVLHISYDDTEILDKMFVLLDAFLGQILHRLRNEDHLLLVSDHGFTNVNSVLFMNEWLASRKYIEIPRPFSSKILSLLGFNWDKLSQPGFYSNLYKFGLRYFPGLVNFAKKEASSGLVLSDDIKLKSQICALGINEPVAWIRLSRDSKNDVNKVAKQLQELKKEGLLKNVFKSRDIFNGKYIENVLGQLIVEATQGCAIDTTRINDGKLEGKPLLTKKGIHQHEGVLGYIGRYNLSSGMPAYRLQDIVPTVLTLMALPIPGNLDGIAILNVAGEKSTPWKLDVSESF